MSPEVKTSLYGLDLAELRTKLQAAGLPAYGANQIYRWLYKKGSFRPQDWSDVSAKIKQYVERRLELRLPGIAHRHVSQDGTQKFLIALGDGHSVECVAINARARLTLCLSTQVGCAIGCTFCHTATMGFSRHLQAAEIVGQYLAVRRQLDKEVTNIVYMGQGEPLHNFEQVRKATMILMQEQGPGLGRRKITLSTSGLVPAIERLWEFPAVNIAISLHSTSDTIRSELMPINKRYDLRRLFAAIKKIPLAARERITYEYLLIKDVNDSAEDIAGLCSLLNPKESKVNLIPFNEYPASHFKSPGRQKVRWFQKELINAGFICTVRAVKGDDILAACGQLKSSRVHSK